MAVAVLAVAYGSKAPSLGVAEFSPSAQQTLESPPTTSANDSSGRGGAGRGRATTTTAPPVTAAPDGSTPEAGPPTTRVGRGRQCYGNPPRQTEDPMSPPCLATIFEDDNGGATSRGVNETEIRVGVPVWGKEGDHIRVLDALFAYFNQNYEFYGRKLVPVYSVGDSSSALSSRTRGAELAAQNVFAALTGIAEWQVGQAALPAELARQNIVTVVHGPAAWWTDKTLYDATHPYIWSVYPSAETLQNNLGSFACSSLAGSPAKFAKDTTLNGSTRKFGLVVLNQQNQTPTTILSKALANCTGETPMKVEWISANGSASLRTALEKLKSGGVTTTICVCEAGNVDSAIYNSNQIKFYPEWVITPSYWATGNDENWLQPYRQRNEVSTPIRLGSGPKLLPIQARPWYQAIQTTLTATDQWGVYTVLGMSEFLYPELLVLASGIQAAGPSLTPDSFAQGLMATQYPNPGAGQAPSYQPSAGFGPGDHSLYNDFNIGWWSDTANALDTGLSSFNTGSWCYVDLGARYSTGRFPSSADAASKLFNPAAGCR